MKIFIGAYRMTKDIFLILTILVSIVTADDVSSPLLINTPSLGWIQGEINPLVDNVRQFLGIPFAQPPIRKLRFKPPVPPVKGASSAVYSATAAAHQGGLPLLRCLEISLSNASVFHGQEDCLYLDIFLPLNVSSATLLPVVVYIYGGGFETSDPHNPSELISLYQNVIYVAIRYRINVFGFMASTALSASRSGAIQSSGLQGFEDQQLAMKWVRDNIQVYGGDPNSITLQGHSAGAISICLHLVAPASQNLFHRVIIESGGCDITQMTLPQAEEIGDEISSHFCNAASDVIECLQSIDAATLLQYSLSKEYLNFFTSNGFHLLVDGLIVPDSVINLFQNGAFPTNVPILTGSTTAEFGLFIAGRFEPGWQVENVTQETLSEWVQLFSEGQSAYLNTTYNPYVNPSVSPTLLNYYGLTDALSTGVFQCPVRRTAAHVANTGSSSVYLYSFGYVPLQSPFADLQQSIHGEELPFVFNSPNTTKPQQQSLSADTFNPDEQTLAWAMSLLWMRFVVHGNPNTPLNNETSNPLIDQLSQLGGWPKYATTNPSSYLIISNIAARNSSATIRLATDGYHSPTCAAWDEIVPNPNITRRCNVNYGGVNCTRINGALLNTVSFVLFNPMWIFVHIYYRNYF